MPNDEIRMSNQIRMTNVGMPSPLRYPAALSSFELRHSFDIRISSFVIQHSQYGGGNAPRRSRIFPELLDTPPRHPSR